MQDKYLFGIMEVTILQFDLLMLEKTKWKNLLVNSKTSIMMMLQVKFSQAAIHLFLLETVRVYRPEIPTQEQVSL